MKGKNFKEDATAAEANEYAETVDADMKGTGREPGGAESDAEGGGDPRCPSDWIVIDCFWCAVSNCCNPRWHVVMCLNCGKPSTY